MYSEYFFANIKKTTILNVHSAHDIAKLFAPSYTVYTELVLFKGVLTWGNVFLVSVKIFRLQARHTLIVIKIIWKAILRRNETKTFSRIPRSRLLIGQISVHRNIFFPI